MTLETRKKISESMKKAIRKNPLISPFISHSVKKERSYLEKKFKEELLKREIGGWIEEYFHGIYRYDFAFPSLKIDVEIDGSQHTLLENIEKDRIRDEWSISQGWRVLRIEGKVVKHDIELAISKLLEFIGKENLETLKKVKLENFLTERQKRRIEKKKRLSEFQKMKNEKIEQIKNLILSSDLDFSKYGWSLKLSQIVPIKPWKIPKWMKKNMPEFYEEKCFKKGITKSSPNYKSKETLLKEKILNSGIDFSKKGWNKELQKITGVFRIKNFIRKNLPEIWEKCSESNFYSSSLSS